MGERIAGTTGRPYPSLGTALPTRGPIDGGGLPAIRCAPEAMSPARRAEALAPNARCTFFKRS